MPDPDKTDDDTYSEEETVARREATLKRLLSTPPTPRTKPESDSAKPNRGRPKKGKAAG